MWADAACTMHGIYKFSSHSWLNFLVVEGIVAGLWQDCGSCGIVVVVSWRHGGPGAAPLVACARLCPHACCIVMLLGLSFGTEYEYGTLSRTGGVTAVRPYQQCAVEAQHEYSP